MKGIEKVLLDERQLAEKISQLGQKITCDYRGKDLLVCGILKGSTIFMSDLIRQVDLPLCTDYMRVSSYGSGTTSGDVNILLDISTDIRGKDVLICEDVFDSGRTLAALISTLKKRSPASLKICCLFSKPARREVSLKIDYLGFELPDEFVVGFGLDYNESYRNLPYLAVLSREIYE